MAKDGYATKSDINQLRTEIKGDITKLRTEVKDDINGLRTEVKEDIGNLKSEMIDIKVEILGELKNMREEFSTHQFSHMRINDELEEHNQRLIKSGSPQI